MFLHKKLCFQRGKNCSRVALLQMRALLTPEKKTHLNIKTQNICAVVQCSMFELEKDKEHYLLDHYQTFNLFIQLYLPLSCFSLDWLSSHHQVIMHSNFLTIIQFLYHCYSLHSSKQLLFRGSMEMIGELLTVNLVLCFHYFIVSNSDVFCLTFFRIPI